MRKRERRREKRGWWDEECEEKRKEVRKKLREWRKRGGGGERYRKARAEYKLLCKGKREEERIRWYKEAIEARTEGEVWKVINRERRKRKGANEEIKAEEWKGYFMDLLGGVESKVVRGGKEKGERDGEQEISREEVKRILGKMKKGKAAGEDGIPSEVWKYGGERIEEWVREMCNRVWRGEGWPERWKEGIIVPLIKKGAGDRVENYRGVTLMPTIYKIYVGILTERLREEMEEGNMIPESQTGFRKGMEVIDNIYVLNYLINGKVKKKGGKVVTAFIDLKAAFDSVDREVLMEAMEIRRVREGLRRRIEEVYRETRSKVRVGKEEGESFWTARGVRQGCPMSPHLFNLLIADVEEVMEKRRMGWGQTGRGKSAMPSICG